jgi:hypothetical protein
MEIECSLSARIASSKGRLKTQTTRNMAIIRIPNFKEIGSVLIRMQSNYLLLFIDSLPCTLIDDSPFPLNTTDTKQFVRARTFAPYKSYLWTYQITDINTDVYKFNAFIVVVELDIPKLSLDIPPGWSQRQINVNEQLDIKCNLDKDVNVDLIDFSTQVIYDFNIVGIIRFEYFKMRISVWEKFIDF